MKLQVQDFDRLWPASWVPRMVDNLTLDEVKKNNNQLYFCGNCQTTKQKQKQTRCITLESSTADNMVLHKDHQWSSAIKTCRWLNHHVTIIFVTGRYEGSHLLLMLTAQTERTGHVSDPRSRSRSSRKLVPSHASRHFRLFVVLATIPFFCRPW